MTASTITHQTGDLLSGVTLTLPVGVSGALVLGYSVADWVLILTAVAAIGNTILIGDRLYEFFKKRFGKHKEP